MGRNCSAYLFYFLACIALGIGLFLLGIYFANEGLFTGWVSVGDPLPKAEHILRSRNDGQIWVATQDGLVYRSSNAHPTWIIEKDFPGKDSFLDVQSGSCRFRDQDDPGFLRQPPGNIVECARILSATEFGHDVTFSVILEDRTIWELQLIGHTGDPLGWLALFWWLVFIGIPASIWIYIKRKQLGFLKDNTL